MQEMLGKLFFRHVRGLTIRAHGDRKDLGIFAERVCAMFTRSGKMCGEGKGYMLMC
jgi:hypothetical protein